jgi:hypothetical protein
MKRLSLQAIEQDGFAIVPDLVDADTVSSLVEELRGIYSGEALSSRGESVFALRNLLNEVPITQPLIASPAMRSLLEPIVGANARATRGIFFDKTPEANWKVAWHQDLTIAVRRRVDIEGYGPWSVKAGINHVQPPVWVLENILTLRIHLDDTDEANGALKIIPGSHKDGRLTHEDIQSWKRKASPVICRVPRGGVLMMRPLLLHSSSASPRPTHRRVLHLDFSASNLPGELEWFGS